MILAPDSKDLIAGVRIHPYPVWPDDRGYFLEVARIGQGLPAAFPQRHHAGFGGAQLSRHHQGLSLPSPPDRLLGAAGWHAASGAGGLAHRIPYLRRPQHALRRRATGAGKCWFRPASAHGYKVIGTGPAMLVYLTDRFYDPQDEGRIPYDDPQHSIRLGNPAQIMFR